MLEGGASRGVCDGEVGRGRREGYMVKRGGYIA